MKDIIWTLIIIWLIYKVVDVFRISSRKIQEEQKASGDLHFSTKENKNPKDKDIKSAVQKHLNNEGEYVDFEEVK